MYKLNINTRHIYTLKKINKMYKFYNMYTLYKKKKFIVLYLVNNSTDIIQTQLHTNTITY
jgi:hypothetical protein